MSTTTDRSSVETLKQVPFEILSRAYKERYAELREELGPQFTVRKVRTCRGCGGDFSAREMRTHDCKDKNGKPVSWKRRYTVDDPISR
jgi:hypothetical protein